MRLLLFLALLLSLDACQSPSRFQGSAQPIGTVNTEAGKSGLRAGPGPGETRPRAFGGLVGTAQPAGYAPAVLLPEFGQLGQELAGPDRT